MSAQPDDLTAFTRTLANVPPHAGNLDRDALLFAAGRAAGRRGAFWPATAVMLAGLSAALAVALVARPPTVVEVVRLVSVPTPATPENTARQPVPDAPADTAPGPAASPDWVAGMRLRQRILRDGVGALPQAPWVAPSPSSGDVPDLSSLRLNASHPDGGLFR